MRLIDADELIKNIDYSADMGGALGKVVECVKYYAKFMVASAPTKEERKTGIWRRAEYGYTCNQCGKTNTTRTAYCPSCGAEMDF